jgi:putative transposase
LLERRRISLTAVQPPEGQRGFTLLPRRWVVERTFSWLYQSRRLSKDYERLAETSEVVVYMAMMRLMLRRLAPY